MASINRFRVWVAIGVMWTMVSIGRAQESSGTGSLAKPFYESGIALTGQGDFEGAIVDLSKAIEIDPKNSTFYSARGNARNNLGLLDEAIADFTKAIELDGTRRVPYINRGVAKVDKGDLDGALADYSKVIMLDPKNATAYRNRGCVQQQKGDFDSARSDFQQSIQLSTDEGAYQRFYLFLIGLRQKSGASSGAELKLVVNRWKDGWKKTVGLFLAGDVNEALFFELAAQGTPKVVRDQKCEAFYYAGSLRLSKGDNTGGKELLERCVATQLHTFPEFQLARSELIRIGSKP